MRFAYVQNLACQICSSIFRYRTTNFLVEIRKSARGAPRCDVCMVMVGSEYIIQQLCTRVAQLEGKQSAASVHQQHDSVLARKFEILAAQVNVVSALSL